MYIDLTLPLSNDGAKNAQAAEAKALVGHLGTHFDVMDKQFPLEYLKRNGVVFDVSDVIDRDIDIDDINMDMVKSDMFVSFYTGHIENNEYGSKEYFKGHPQLSKDLIDALLEKKVSMIGVDLPGIRRSVEHTPTDRLCADNNTFVIENMVNLKQLVGKEKVVIYTFPMNYVGISGLPCRIVAELE